MFNESFQGMVARQRPRNAGDLSSQARSMRTGKTRRVRKTAELVALEIVRDIVDLGLEAGASLPLEAQMLEHYGVSRSSLREAMRLLETQGLISIRPGPGAGTVVAEHCPSNLGRTMTLHFHMVGASYDELLQSWLMTEPQLARLAAANPDVELREARMSAFLPSPDGEDLQSISHGLSFHDEVAELANNRALSTLCRAIGYVVSDQVLSAVRREALETFIIDEHAALARAIIAGDGPLAGDLMHEHVAHVIKDFQAYFPDKVGQRLDWR